MAILQGSCTSLHSSPDILHLWHSDALFEKNSPLPKARFCSLLNLLSLDFLSMRSRDVPKCYLLNLGRHCYCHIVTCDSNLCFKFLQNVLTLNVTCHNYDVSEVTAVALLESFSARLQSISEIVYRKLFSVSSAKSYQVPHVGKIFF